MAARSCAALNIFLYGICGVRACFGSQSYNPVMRPTLEKVVFGDASFLTFERIMPVFPHYWHYHPEFQLTLVVDGHGRRTVGNRVADYGPGDLVLLGSNLPHTWYSHSLDCKRSRPQHTVDVQFRADVLNDPLFKAEEFRPLYGLLERSAYGLAFGDTAVGNAVAKQVSRLPYLSPSRRAINILGVLLDLAAESNAGILSTRDASTSCHTEDRVDQICSYLKTHSERKIDFASVARHFRMDLASLCRCFKRSTGRTMTTYVNETRVAMASLMLAETDLSLTEIGFRVGFGNYSHFNHQFKRIKGLPPRSFKRQLRLD